MITTLNNDMATCMYCGEQISSTTEGILEHIVICEKRPELRLLMKIQVFEHAGDRLIKTIHSVVKALAEIEGMRSKSWEIYHLSKEKWEIVKQLTAEEIEEIRRRESENEQENS